MIYLFLILSVITIIISAAYLQLPTFILALGYSWFHRYKLKRWIWRSISICCFAMFLYHDPTRWLLIVISIFFLFFLIFSLVNANPKVYVALNENQIIKTAKGNYPPETEILGYLDDNGKAVCYPLLEMIKPRHLLNDIFNNKPLLVSYCMACRSAMVFNPMVKGKRLKFEVLGVYRRNMVMGDRSTGTIWQQGTGEAMYGPLRGQRLEFLPYQQTSLKDWLKQYPDTLIASESHEVKDGIFSKARLIKMMKVTETLVAPGRTSLHGLPLRESIFGIEIDGFSKAYPISELKKRSSFTDRLGEIDLQINYSATTNILEIKDLQHGKIIPAQSHWWFGWKEFHPNTEIWKS